MFAVRSVSQPLWSALSQLPYPMAHEATTHAAFMHPATACGSWAHANPQLPQLFGSTLPLISQPLGAIPSQLRKPGLHDASTHIPPTQPAMALGSAQAWPHAPQLFTDRKSTRLNSSHLG